MAATPGKIAGHVTKCLDLFRSVVRASDSFHTDPPNLSFVRQMTDENTRFKVWSGNIGAHRSGVSSLDYRLRDSSHIRNQVTSLLEELIGLLEDSNAIITGEETPWDQLSAEQDATSDEEADSDGTPETELDQISIDVTDVVDCLLRLSITIRNPAPHDRFMQSQFTDTSHYEPFDIQHVRSKFHSIDPKLAERLGKAISRRRQYFKYRMAHHTKLSYGLDNHNLADTEDPPHTIASSLPEHLKDILESNQTRDASAFKDDRSDTGFSETSYATSMAANEQRRIPPLPEEASRGPFECPFCYTIISVTNRRAWKYDKVTPSSIRS